MGVAHEVQESQSEVEEVSMVAHEVTDASEAGASIVAHVVQETEPQEQPESALDTEEEAAVVHESDDEESTPELEVVKETAEEEEEKDVEKSKEDEVETEKELTTEATTGESGACSLEATCESPTDDLNSEGGSEEGGVSTDEGIAGSDEDNEKESDNLEKAKKSTEA